MDMYSHKTKKIKKVIVFERKFRTQNQGYKIKSEKLKESE